MRPYHIVHDKNNLTGNKTKIITLYNDIFNTSCNKLGTVKEKKPAAQVTSSLSRYTIAHGPSIAGALHF